MDKMNSSASQTSHLSSPALQNWQAMVPGLEQQMAELALTSAGTVLYQWSLETGQLTFSQNIEQVFPFEMAKLPQTIDEWKSLSDDRDNSLVDQTLRQWSESDGTFELRYRICNEGGAADKAIWLKHHATHESNSDIVVGAIAFNVRPPLEHRIFNGKTVSTMIQSHLSGSEVQLNGGEFICSLQETMDDKANASIGCFVVIQMLNIGLIDRGFGQEAVENVMGELLLKANHLIPNGARFYRVQRDQLGIILPQYTKIKAEEWIREFNQHVHDYGAHSSIGPIHLCSVCHSSAYGGNKQQTAPKLVEQALQRLQQLPECLNQSLAQYPEDQMLLRQQMKLASYLADSLKHEKIKLAYQPIVNTHTGEVSYYEALLRLIDDNGHISSAGALIPVAERMGLIQHVDKRVVELVIKELEINPDVKLAFNVSNLTTDDPEWLAHFRHLLNNRHEIASRLCVEITETAAQRDLRRTAYFVAMVQEMGCEVALDDFGSGYTSFRQLKMLSVDTVKIDGDFVRDLAENSDNRFFIKTLLEFTQLFGLKSVAEYVENGEVAKILMELGVDNLQGYYFGKPELQRSWPKKGEYEPS